MEIFRELGLGDRTFLTFASGGDYAKYSHEFAKVRASKTGKAFAINHYRLLF